MVTAMIVLAVVALVAFLAFQGVRGVGAYWGGAADASDAFTRKRSRIRVAKHSPQHDVYTGWLAGVYKIGYESEMKRKKGLR